MFAQFLFDMPKLSILLWKHDSLALIQKLGALNMTWDLKWECSWLWRDYVHVARLPVWSESQHAGSGEFNRQAQRQNIRTLLGMLLLLIDYWIELVCCCIFIIWKFHAAVPYSAYVNSCLVTIKPFNNYWNDLSEILSVPLSTLRNLFQCGPQKFSERLVGFTVLHV